MCVVVMCTYRHICRPMHVEVKSQLFGVGALPWFAKQQTQVASHQPACCGKHPRPLSHFHSLLFFLNNDHFIFKIFSIYLGGAHTHTHTHVSQPFVEGIGLFSQFFLIIWTFENFIYGLMCFGQIDSSPPTLFHHRLSLSSSYALFSFLTY